MTFSIRKLQVPDDYHQLATLYNHILTESVTVENLALNDSKMYTTGELGKNENQCADAQNQPR